MKRDVYRRLVEWKNSPRRKPLILRGIRQSGKTYLLRKFGTKEFSNNAYFNFEEDPQLAGFFEHHLDPERLVKNLSLYSGKRIMPSETLIIFDEIQAAPRALNSLKYFCEEGASYYVATAGSLLGIRMSNMESFPVGKVNFLDLYPLSFLEFLDATGKSEWRRLIEDLTEFTPLPEPLHLELIHSLKRYYVVGGMPEPVSIFANTGDLAEVRTIQNEILDAYALDFAKHAPSGDAPKISRVWSSIASQLARENKKFKFSDVTPNARAREFEDAIEWLADAGLILRACNVGKPGIPLAGYSNRRYFKLYAADVGLLGAMARVPQNILVKGHDLFTEFNGALVENYVAQQLRSNDRADLFYWTSQGRAEVDFLVENNGQVFPLEVKAGINPKSRSLRAYGEKYPDSVLSRTTLLNLRCDGKVHNYPLYAISRFPMGTPDGT